MKKITILSGVLAVMAVGITGCTQEAREDYGSAGKKIEQGANKVGEGVQTDAMKSGEAIQEGAENAKEAAENAGKEIAETGDNAKTTLAVKNGILSADDVDASHINVDTDESTVYLRGSVLNASSKKRVENIAKNIVGTKYKVKSELTVNPNP